VDCFVGATVRTKNLARMKFPAHDERIVPRYVAIQPP